MKSLRQRPAFLDERLWFPPAEGALTAGLNRGLVAVGGDLSVARLLLAYRSGIFPWSADPITWWSPEPRAVFEPGGFHVSRSLRTFLRKAPFTVTFDRAFREVMIGCADPSRPGGWIGPEFIAAYTALHVAGHAHSVECWAGDELVGGVYGVATGGLFAGESMFHRATNASKVALFHLTERLWKNGFGLFDIQMVTSATAQLGATEIPRAEYLRRLASALELPATF